MSFNKIIIVGRLGRDPELRYTAGGKAVCNFTVATDDVRQGGEKTTTWFRVTAFGKTAENASQYLAKGKQVLIDGRLSLSEWQDKQGGNRTTAEVSANDIRFLEPRSSAGDAAAMPFAGRRDTDEDIPF